MRTSLFRETEYGMLFRLRAPIDGSETGSLGETHTRIARFKRPDDTIVDLEAVDIDAKNGDFGPQIPEDFFLGHAGTWQVQLRLTFQGGSVNVHSDVREFIVAESLPDAE